MKKFAKKYLAVLLALTLVLGMGVPSAKVEADGAAAIETLKEAWGKMYLADTLMSPTIEKVSGTNTQSSVYNTADGID
ncbi:MAG: hypothetical protein IJZ75_02800, partial [Clostridia bacterium]|nr:hypothetical protein [Clostridia bacterium]